MPYIRVTYKNREYGFDYVPTHQIAHLIAQDEITHFFRSSEKRWVNVRCDKIRGSGGFYRGPERRTENASHPKEEQGSNGKRQDARWMEQLWTHLENS
jgi:hypothetical protein